jgi:hypothetical protein
MIMTASILQTHFESDRCRHIADGMTIVLHCHHFATLTTQLANDCSMVDAKKLLAESSEDAFHTILANYYEQNGICNLKERIEIAERYFSDIGLGKLKVNYAGTYAGEIELRHSHVDEGWLKKWGKSSEPVNHIGRGYATALFSALFGKQKRSYFAKECQSIACGAQTSIITVTDIADAEKGGN